MADPAEIDALVAAENARLVAVLDGVDDDGWRTPSPCPGWTVRDVAVHLLMAYRLSIPGFLARMVRYRFDFDRLALHWAAEDTQSPAEVLAALRRIPTERFGVPGAPPEAPLSHLVIHAQDVARPLGTTLDPDPRAAAIVLDQLTGTRFTYLSEAARAGVEWVATDADWRHGEGPEVRGASRTLVTVLGGRPEALAELEGDGADEVRRRLAPG